MADDERRRIFRRRALVLGGLQVGLFGALGARLWDLQVDHAAEFSLLAEDNRANQRLLVPARGRILDRNGLVLAANAPAYRVSIVREQAHDVPGLLHRLAMLIALDEERIDFIAQQAKARPAFVPIPIRDDLSWDEVSRIAVRTPDLPGLILESSLLRVYPERDLTAHVLGYVGAVNEAEQAADPDPLLRLPEVRIGKAGIEKRYDPQLRGRAGLSRIEVNAVGRELRELDRREGQPGQELPLSLDLRLQRFCHARLSGELAASAVILDVRTGGVLALASVPSFDPQVFANGLSQGVWTELRDNKRTPLVNKCIRGQYPPGSTFKMMTALAALEAGAVTVDTQVYCGGVVTLGRAQFHCWKAGGHGRLSMLQGLGQSCDCYFYELAKRVGVDAIAAMGNRFGLGLKVGIDLPGELPGLLPTTAWKKAKLGVAWQKGETLVCGIGQGFVSATPLQLAVMSARLATGRAIVPAFVHDPEIPAPESLGIAPEHLDAVCRGMHEVVNGKRGTARGAILNIPGVELAGKTGTAQVRRISKLDRATGRYKRKDIPWIQRDHALFVCFAPWDAPRYAISVVVEHGVSGAKAAAPIARDLMRKTLELDPAKGTGDVVASSG